MKLQLSRSERATRRMPRLQELLLLGAGLFLLALPLLVRVLYVQHLLILIFMYVALSTSWNIIGGYAGYESFGHIVFFGAGAYASGLLLVHLGLSPLLTAPLAGLFACLVALIALPSLRTREAYFAITTLALAFVGQLIVLNVDSVTKGGRGMFLPLPPWGPDLSKLIFYYAMLLAAAGALGLSYLVKRSKFGLGLELIRDEEDKAEAVGVDTTTYKALAFVLSAFFPGVVGAIHGYYLNYISPSSTFNILISINILLFAIFGGKGTLAGPVLGAVLLIPASQFLNIILVSELHLLMFGVLLIVVVLFLPDGVVSLFRRRKADRVELHPEQPAIQLAEFPDSGRIRTEPAVYNGKILLSLQDVSKHFGGVKALDGCSFNIAEGTVTGLIGPNGSGKSTVINVITGFYRADAGTITYQGKAQNGLKPHRVKAMGIARSFQETRVFGSLTVLENVIASVSGRSGRSLLERRFQPDEVDRAMTLLELVGLVPWRRARASDLSYGQQKLLEFASVVMAEPELILLDEPAAGVNPILVERLMNFVHHLNRQGTTFLVVEHDMGVIMNYCNPVIVMDAGQALMEGTPQVVQNDPRVLEAYLGE